MTRDPNISRSETYDIVEDLVNMAEHPNLYTKEEMTLLMQGAVIVIKELRGMIIGRNMLEGIETEGSA